MARRLILDTGVIVAGERGTLNLRAVMGDDDDVVIAAITLAELRVGIELADAAHRERRERFVGVILDEIPLEPYDGATAQAHARLLAHVAQTGLRPGAHDLLIAATAVSTRRTIITTDRRARFDDLPGVDCIVID